MLYETCARAEDILGLDVPDLDMEFRRALAVEKGGGPFRRVSWITWGRNDGDSRFVSPGVSVSRPRRNPAFVHSGRKNGPDQRKRLVRAMINCAPRRT